MRSLLPLVLVAACGAPPDADPPDDTDSDGPPTDAAPGIRFDARFGDLPARCGTLYEEIGLTGVGVRLLDLRMFVSELRVSGPDGEAAVLLEATTWSSGEVALLDFEDGTADCAAAGDARTNDLVRGYIPPGAWDTLTFALGVPFELNHLDPVGATPPLDTGSMFWNRQSGYTFLRADLALDRTFQTWLTQIGSAGCTSPSAQEAPEGCTRPNRARVRVPFDPTSPGTVVLDLSVLLGAVPIGVDGGGPVGCRMDVLDTGECGPVFETLGMTYGSGACVDDCKGQTAFSFEPG